MWSGCKFTKLPSCGFLCVLHVKILLKYKFDSVSSTQRKKIFGWITNWRSNSESRYRILFWSDQTLGRLIRRRFPTTTSRDLSKKCHRRTSSRIVRFRRISHNIEYGSNEYYYIEIYIFNFLNSFMLAYFIYSFIFGFKKDQAKGYDVIFGSIFWLPTKTTWLPMWSSVSCSSLYFSSF